MRLQQHAYLMAREVCASGTSQILSQKSRRGVPQGWITFGTSGHNPGDVYYLPLQVGSPVAASGISEWSVEVKATVGNNIYDRTVSGILPVVVNAASPFGAGWSLGGIPSLMMGSAGIAIVENNTGGSRYFSGTGPSYTSPANDQGTLVQNSDGSYTYTAKDQVKTNFDSSGRMTSQVDPHGLTQTIAYSGALLSSITQPDGGVATFNYNNNLLSSIQLPGSRTLTPTYDSNNNLTGYTDAAGGVSTFGYDSSHRLISEKVGPLSIAYSYSSSNGTLTQIDRGLGTTLAVTAAATQGLGASTAINANQAYAVLTDGLNHTTNYLLDALGRSTQVQTADGASQSWQRNAAGNPISYVDQLGRTTNYAYNATQDLTQVTNPDGSTRAYQYEMTFHQVTQIQDELGNLTKFSYDTSTGDLLSQTDALNNVTSHTYANGLKQTTTDALNHVTTLQWNTLRQQTARIDALNNKTTYGYDAAGNQTSVQDALGHTTTFTFDGNRRQLTHTNALNGTSSNSYDATGNLVSRTDELGRVTNYAFDQRGFQTSVTETVGTPQQRTTTTAYDAAGNVQSMTDALGDVTQYGYDALNRQTSRTDAYGTSLQRTTTRTYDLAGNVVTIVDAMGTTSKNIYDSRNRLIQHIEAFGTSLQRVTSTTYDAAGNVLTSTDPLGTVTSYTYDADNRPTQQTDAYGTSLQRSSTTAYDAVGNVTSTTNALNVVTNYVYDALNRRTQVIEAYNTSVQRTTATAFDAVSNVASTTNALGIITTYAYDALHRRIQEVDASGTSVQRTLSMSYDAVGNVLTITNGLGVVTSFAYDALNRRASETDAYGTSLARTVTSEYDLDDNMIATIDALNNKTTFGYDALNRQITVQNPDGGTTTTRYDANDNVLSITDPLNHATSYVYDLLNRRTQSTDALGGIVKWSYDANNNLLSLTDPVNNITQWVFDALKRQVQEIDPLGNSEVYAYDALDRLTSTTDRNGQQIASTYDPLNRKTGETWYNASGAQVNALTFTFDADNNLLSAANNAGTNTMTYDNLDRLASVQDSFNTSLTNTYDDADNRTQVQDSFGATTTRIFDTLNRMTSLQLGGSGQTPMREDFTYTARDQVATQLRYSDLAGQNKIGSSTFGYDSVGHLTNLQHLDGSGNNIANYVNAFDLASRITSETLNGGTPTTYTYDNTNQLTNDSVTSYSYDLNGNRTMPGYTTGPANEITSDGTWNYYHDQNGNLVGKTNPTTGETWTYAYDNRNRLTSATQTTSEGLQMQATYVYNALGQRIEKDVTQSGSTTTTRFAYDRGEIWTDLDASNRLQTRYVRGERVLELLARIANGVEAWILADRMGSIRNVVDNTGQVIDTIGYDGYGNVTNEANPTKGGAYMYDGYRLESEINLLRPDSTFGRIYASLIGRWLTLDIIGFDSNDMNLYRYVHNNPVGYTDKFGLQAEKVKTLAELRLELSREIPPWRYYDGPTVDSEDYKVKQIMRKDNFKDFKAGASYTRGWIVVPGFEHEEIRALPPVEKDERVPTIFGNYKFSYAPKNPIKVDLVFEVAVPVGSIVTIKGSASHTFFEDKLGQEVSGSIQRELGVEYRVYFVQRVMSEVGTMFQKMLAFTGKRNRDVAIFRRRCRQ
jgi:RHS repeat-associated protein